MFSEVSIHKYPRSYWRITCQLSLPLTYIVAIINKNMKHIKSIYFTELHRENVCKLQVFYEDLNLEVITERRSYEVGLLR